MKKLTKDEFVSKAQIHGDKYDYSLVNYINTRTKVMIKCNDCGYIFPQSPDSLRIKYLREHTFDNCRYKYKLPFDFYLPILNMCIEYDGLQHYKPIDYFGGIEKFEEIQIKDKIRDNYCFKNGIFLLRISYKDKINEKMDFLFNI